MIVSSSAVGGETHHRHPHHHLHEASPLLRHMSMDQEEATEVKEHGRHLLQASASSSSLLCCCNTTLRKRAMNRPGTLLVLFATFLAFCLPLVLYMEPHSRGIIPIERAREYRLTVEQCQRRARNVTASSRIDAVVSSSTATRHHNVSSLVDIQVWYRVWGNRKEGIPVLFVHGGPGQAIADYHNGNGHFFADERFWVIEVDQRGTGKSLPSVRDNLDNTQYYADISIDQIAADFELIRQELGIEQWIVWGGSFGSTIAINYGTRYPERCLALFLRGIYLDTVPEVHAVYSRDMYKDNPERLREFNILYDYAVENDPDETLEPNDAESLLRIYSQLILNGNREATWHWYVFENNLMIEDPSELLDPEAIEDERFSEAQSVSFFETRLWLRGSFELPSNLLDRVDRLVNIPIWICQGKRDEVCPVHYARKFTDALNQTMLAKRRSSRRRVGSLLRASFPDAGHKQTDPLIAQCLLDSLEEFEEIVDSL